MVFHFFTLELDHFFIASVTLTVTVRTPKMSLNNKDIPDGLSIVDKYVQITINKLHLLK